MGSTGEPVVLLQKALNFASPSALPKLKEDAQFGPRTRNRVVEFQNVQRISADGIVGPITWSVLEPIIREILAIVDQQFPSNVDEGPRRKQIAEVAQRSFDMWGWGDAGEVIPDGSPRIAATRGFGPASGGFRERQGGAALGIIYSMAGVGGANCLRISTEIEKVYQQDGRTHPDRRTKLNQRDIGSWCGIFATYCLRASGLKVCWSDMRSQSASMFQILGPNDPVLPGDVGVFDPALNHHFVVIAASGPGEKIYSIDGNVGNPSERTVCPWNSVISKRSYLRQTLRNKGGRFLRPVFSAMV